MFGGFWHPLGPRLGPKWHPKSPAFRINHVAHRAHLAPQILLELLGVSIWDVFEDSGNPYEYLSYI